MDLSSYFATGQYRFHYEMLENEDEKSAYMQILEGLMNFKTDIIVNNCSAATAMRIFPLIKNDIPELFYIKECRVMGFKHIRRCKVLPEYRFSSQLCIQTFSAMEEKYRDFLHHFRSAPELTKELAIHSLILSHSNYKDAERAYSHEAPGVLLYDIGVCEGISKAFKYLADRLGLKSMVVQGRTFNASDSQANHAWNMIELSDGHFYHLDITYDQGLSQLHTRYDYFNISDSEMSRDRSWSDIYPACPKSFGIYSRMGLRPASKAELARLIKNELADKKSFSFQLPPDTYTSESASNLVRSILSSPKFFPKNCFLRYRFIFDEDSGVFSMEVL